MLSMVDHRDDNVLLVTEVYQYCADMILGFTLEMALVAKDWW